MVDNPDKDKKRLLSVEYFKADFKDLFWEKQSLFIITFKPGFHYTTNTTTTTQKQSDYKVEQSSFTLIALV